MLLPLSWLRDTVDLEGIEIKTIEDGLFSCGLEVEEKTPLSPDISGIVAGKILEIRRHPDSDHMFVCDVNCGRDNPCVQIVTGAQNVKKDDTVPVALVGARVYERAKDGEETKKTVVIKSGKLRGIRSDGMLCSGEEAGIDDDWYEGAGVNGIMMLPEDSKPGEDVKKLLGLDDEVWDISVTANLPHCQHVFGIARELAALLDRPVHTPDMTFETRGGKTPPLSVEVEAPDLCPRYIGHYVYDVKAVRSPELMRRRLIMCGLHPINAVVDITNYVLLEMGQPMHAFDAARIGGNKIVVRRAKNGEKIVTLDGNEFDLTSEMLVICDADKPVALAGIMGGINSEITENTESVLFESAKFLRGNIRRTSRKLGQVSDSSSRFEKGVDEYTTELAMNRALNLIEKLGCGKVSGLRMDIRADKNPKREVVRASFGEINEILGIEVPKDETAAILRRMNYDIDIDGDKLTATAPPYRNDIEGTAADLAEDVIKMYGYRHIVPHFMSKASITAGGPDRKQRNTRDLKHLLTAAGFCETVSYSFFSEEELDMLKIPEDSEARNLVRIQNPLSEKYAVMRSLLAPTLVNILSKNAKRGNENVRIYELARVFIKGKDADTLPEERKHLCFALYGKDEDFFTAKGTLDLISSLFGMKFEYTREMICFLHPGASALVSCEGETVGYLGQLAYDIAFGREILQPAFICEIDYEMLANHMKDRMKYVPVSQFRDIRRDLAVVAPESMTCGEIEKVIYSACDKISRVSLFDVYRGDQVAEGFKSMAFNITFAHGENDREMQSGDIDKFISKILKSLEYRLGLKIRS